MYVVHVVDVSPRHVSSNKPAKFRIRVRVNGERYICMFIIEHQIRIRNMSEIAYIYIWYLLVK